MAWGKESSVAQSDGVSEELAVHPRSREVHARTQTGRGTAPEKQVEADVSGDTPWAGDCKLSLEGVQGCSAPSMSDLWKMSCRSVCWPRPPAHLQPLFSFPGEVQQDLIV